MWKSVFQNIPVACLVLRIDDREKFLVAEVNSSYLELTRTCRENLLGKDIFKALPLSPASEKKMVPINFFFPS